VRGKNKLIWLEEGSEERNQILRNFIASDDDFSGIWYENMNNDVIGNHIVTTRTCFDYRLDDNNPTAVDFGTFVNDPRNLGITTANGYLIPIGSSRVISSATWPFGKHEGNYCHSSNKIVDQVEKEKKRR